MFHQKISSVTLKYGHWCSHHTSVIPRLGDKVPLAPLQWCSGSHDSDVVSGSLPKVKIIHDLRTQGFLAFRNQGDKV